MIMYMRPSHLKGKISKEAYSLAMERGITFFENSEIFKSMNPPTSLANGEGERAGFAYAKKIAWYRQMVKDYDDERTYLLHTLHWGIYSDV